MLDSDYSCCNRAHMLSLTQARLMSSLSKIFDSPLYTCSGVYAVWEKSACGAAEGSLLGAAATIRLLRLVWHYLPFIRGRTARRVLLCFPHAVSKVILGSLKERLLSDRFESRAQL